MEYLCLAAGKGTRFGELGRYLQKCMYPVGLRPFLEYSIRNLTRSAGFDADRDRLTLVVGHHGEQLRAYFGDCYGRLRLQYLEQPAALGTGHALRLAGRALDPTEPVIAWLADSYVPAERFAALRAHPDANVLTLAPDPTAANPDVGVTVDGDRVTRAWRGEAGAYDIGLWKFEPAVLAEMTAVAVDEYRALPNLQRLVDRGLRVGHLAAADWLHLGGTDPTPEANTLAVTAEVARREQLRLPAVGDAPPNPTGPDPEAGAGA